MLSSAPIKALPTVLAPRESESDLLWAHDVHGVLRFVNEPAARVLGRPKQQLEGTCLWDLLDDPTQVLRARRAFEHVMSGRTWETEWQYNSTLLRVCSEPVIDSSTNEIVGVLSKAEVLSQGPPRRDFMEYLVGERNLSYATAYTYESSLKRVETWTGKEASEVSMDDIRGFLRHSKYNPASKNASLVALKAYRRFGVLEGWWEPDGILLMPGPRIIRDPKPALSPEEARTVLDMCKRPNETRVIFFGLYQGMRVSESARITSNEWRGDRLRFQAKGRRMHELPVHANVQEKRDLILAHHPTVGSLKQTVRSMSLVTGLPFTSHSLRRSFGVQLSELGVNREVIGALLGHSPSTVTTQSYVPIRWAEKVAAIAELTYRDCTPNPGSEVRELFFGKEH